MMDKIELRLAILEILLEDDDLRDIHKTLQIAEVIEDWICRGIVPINYNAN